MNDKKDLFKACLLYGAIGDALGYNIEFMSLNEIKSKFGEQGITDLYINNESGKALISDDTQMTLFTADGLMWAYYRMKERWIGSFAASGIYPSYLRWYYTQTEKMPSHNDEFFLKHQNFEGDDSILNYKELFSQRAPGNTCLSALGSGRMGTIKEH